MESGKVLHSSFPSDPFDLSFSIWHVHYSSLDTLGYERPHESSASLLRYVTSQTSSIGFSYYLRLRETSLGGTADTDSVQTSNENQNWWLRAKSFEKSFSPSLHSFFRPSTSPSQKMGKTVETSPEAAKQAEEVFALRDRLIRDVKQSKKGKVGSGSTTAGQANAG